MMAQRSGQHIIGQNLTDEALRAEFLERPHATLALLGERGANSRTVKWRRSSRRIAGCGGVARNGSTRAFSAAG
jgi:hypothetical protein